MHIADWRDVAIGQISAVAALAGLVFVAISINLSRILAVAGLVGRAAQALALLLAPVFSALFVLVPKQTPRALGIELVGVAVVLTALIGRVLVAAIPAMRERPGYEFAIRLGLTSAAIVPAFVGSVLLITGSATGMYWILAATIMSIVAGVVDAWVLLVEILR